MSFKNYEELFNIVRGKTNRMVVPGANNEEVLTACRMGIENKLISGGILIGPINQVKEMATKAGLPLSGFNLIDKTDYAEMCNMAVDLVKEGMGDFLVKG